MFMECKFGNFNEKYSSLLFLKRDSCKNVFAHAETVLIYWFMISKG